VTPPLPTLGPWVPVYALLAGLMVAGNLFVILRLFPRGRKQPTLATGILLLGILLMSMGLWFAGIYAVISPGDASTVSVFIAVNSMMAVAGIWAISLLFRAGLKPLPPCGLRWPLGFALLIVGNELLMGLTFVLAQVGPAYYTALGGSGLSVAVGDAGTSAWFFWAMLATMAGLITWLPLPRPERTVLYGFAAASAVGPWVVPQPVVGAVGMALVMGVTFALLAQELWRTPRPTPRYLWTALGVASGFLAMLAGEAAAYVLRGTTVSSVPFGLISVLAMAVELIVLFRWGLAAGSAPLPVPRPEGTRSEGPTPYSPSPP
jgi:hypothetical protein